MTIRSAVFAFMDQHYIPFTFTAIWIEFIVMKYTGIDDAKRKHIMRCVREYCDITGAKIETVIRSEGVYHFTPGVCLGNAIVD